MCLDRKHVDYLQRTNETDFREGKISYETYVRFVDITERCAQCDLCGNGLQGDILSECRVHLLRLFISMKRDAESWLRKREAPPIPPPPAPEAAPVVEVAPAAPGKQAANG